MEEIKKHCSAAVRTSRRGPSGSRISARDEKMAYRFYYHAEICNLKYNAVLSALSTEFDIDERVVIKRLRMTQDLLDKIFSEKPATSILRKKFPYYVW